MTKFAQAGIVVVLAWLAGCNQSADRFEDIGKLRGIGILSSPVVAQPSTAAAPSIVTLTFYAAIPAGGNITAAKAFTDAEGATASVPVSLDVDAAGTYQDHSSVRIYTVKARLTIPPAEGLLFDPSSGFAVVHFGIELDSDHGNQDIVGNTVVYPAGATQLAQYSKTPTIDITSPTNNATVGNSKQKVVAALTPVNDETFRVGWFVSSGDVENRNAASTTWDPKGNGDFTVIATARGAQSAAFGISIVDVKTP